MATKADLAFQREAEVIPPAVRLVRDFVNTVEFQVNDEGLREPSDLGSWLAERGLLAPSVGVAPDDLAFAKMLREGLRGVLELHAGHAVHDSAIQRLNESLADLPVRLFFGETERFGFVPASGDPVRAALSRLLDAVRQSVEDETWSRLKVCARDTCRWAYYDYSRNRSSRWCTMAGCGNAVKMKKAYATRKSPVQRDVTALKVG